MSRLSLVSQLAFCLFASLAIVPTAFAYFQVSSPVKNAEWANGQTYGMSWSKGLMDDVSMIDIELARLSTSGLIFVVKNVNVVVNSLNLALNNVPPANDYYLLFLNSTHGVLYGSSAQFSILPSSSVSSANGTLKPDASQPTVTVSGGPNPTALFATTFAAVSAALPGFALPPIYALVVTCFAAFTAGTWTLALL